MSSESSSKPAFVWFSFFITPTDRYRACDDYHCKAQIAGIRFTSTYLDKSSAVILLQNTIIYILSHRKKKKLSDIIPIYSLHVISQFNSPFKKKIYICCYCWIPRLLKAHADFLMSCIYYMLDLDLFIFSCIGFSSSRTKGCQTKEAQKFFIPSCRAQTRLLSHLVPLSKWIILVMVKGNKTKDR